MSCNSVKGLADWTHVPKPGNTNLIICRRGFSQYRNLFTYNYSEPCCPSLLHLRLDLACRCEGKETIANSFK